MDGPVAPAGLDGHPQCVCYFYRDAVLHPQPVTERPVAGFRADNVPLVCTDHLLNHCWPCRVMPEIFRIFQAPFTTSRVSHEDRKPALRGQKEGRMSGDSASWPSRKRSAGLAIAAGGLIAGTLDLTQAFILFGRRVPLA